MSRPCRIAGCDRKHKAKGLCGAHHQRLLKGVDLDAPFPVRYTTDRCSVDDCDGLRHARGYCNTHYARVREHGSADLPIRAPRTWVTRFGYRVTYMPGHPMANSSGAVAEHRLVVAEDIGRPLLASENVHHLNGDRLDNRIENLELWSKSQPAGQRVQDKVAWALELLALYAPECLSPTDFP